MLNAYTREIDYAEDAVAEILPQLGLEKNLLKHSVAIITCCSDFVGTGVVEAICKLLPFDAVGCTTLGNASPGNYGLDGLAVAVLTSDDAEFSTALSADVTAENYPKALADVYMKAKENVRGKPVCAFTFLPIFNNISGADMLRVLNDITDRGVPLFGGLACSQNLDNTDTAVIYNGRTLPDAAAVILVHGNAETRFFVTSIPDDYVQKKQGTVTDSNGYTVKRIEGLPVLEYLKSLGISSDTAINTPTSTVFMIETEQGMQRTAVATYHFDPDGGVLCGAEVPTGSKLSIGKIKYDGVVSTAAKTLQEILDDKNGGVAIMFPCLTRNFMLVTDPDAELRLVNATLGNKIPYILTYGGGEICPVYGADGRIVNKFHNYTFTACLLR
jgi:hypothetical protein